MNGKLFTAAMAILAPAPLSAAPVVPGVSEVLAEERAERLSDIEYTLRFAIPADQQEPITGSEMVTFTLTSVDHDLQLDFRESADKVKSVGVNGIAVQPDLRAEHLILPAAVLREGKNEVQIEFIAGDASLNRNPDYLYTLFVPDRARTAFPVFDQPNLKARYNLTLDLPEGWEALAGGAEQSRETVDGRTVLRFATSDPVPSYLFSFVAGEFEVIEREVQGRTMRLLHRETDEEKVARNIDAIFDQHGAALAWLEDYTGIPYPFQKFDFVIIPSYQFGGMEHVGAIQYNASKLFLEDDPSQPEQLGRANVIAHETAHMWFGDLVTMNWFDDVWTKEVFANFMAAKIVNPSFPEIDHDLNFLLGHVPDAYAVDRTEGANPIRQNLPNLNEAGTLYGSIIYHKAPVMMRQLEMILGEDAFRDGMREYLTRFANGNATWPELVAILDRRTDVDLEEWSKVWVTTAGRPTFVVETGSSLAQTDPSAEGRVWGQRFNLLADQAVEVESGANPIPFDGSAVLFNSDGRGYGLFPADPSTIEARWDSLTDLQKGAQLVNLYEQMLEGSANVTPRDQFDFLRERLMVDDNELLLATMFDQIRTIYWQLLPENDRNADAQALEQVLWSRLNTETLPASTRKSYLMALAGVALTPAMLDRIEAIWSGTLPLPGIKLSDREKTDLAATLAIKLPERQEAILAAQLASLQNPDDRRRLEYLIPSLSDDEAVREAFFQSLSNEANRANESWTLDALSYLHHPLRTQHSRQFILPSLELLEEIQATGDIFFPAGWTVRNLSNHNSAEAAETIREFLAARPDYNHQLRLKILQAADPVFRANKLNPHDSGMRGNMMD